MYGTRESTVTGFCQNHTDEIGRCCQIAWILRLFAIWIALGAHRGAVVTGTYDYARRLALFSLGPETWAITSRLVTVK